MEVSGNGSDSRVGPITRESVNTAVLIIWLASAISLSHAVRRNVLYSKARRSNMIPKMLRRLFALLLVEVGCGLAQVTVPDTPAGHTAKSASLRPPSRVA